MTMNTFMNRNQRRVYEKELKKAKVASAAPEGDRLAEVMEGIQNINSQIVKMVEYNKTIYTTITVLRETLERKGVVSVDDFRETENLYKKVRVIKELKIKEMLSSTMSDVEKIDWCMKEGSVYKHGYDQMGIVPTRDLNITPPVINEYLAEKGIVGEPYKKWATYLGVPTSMQTPQK